MVAGVIARGRLKNKQTYKHSVQFHLQPRSEAEWKEHMLCEKEGPVHSRGQHGNLATCLCSLLCSLIYLCPVLDALLPTYNGLLLGSHDLLTWWL